MVRRSFGIYIQHLIIQKIAQAPLQKNCATKI